MRFRTIIRSCALALAALVITALPARAMSFHDVYILLDKSGSMGLTNFNAQISAIQNLINDYGGQANNPMRFSIRFPVLYSATARCQEGSLLRRRESTPATPF